MNIALRRANTNPQMWFVTVTINDITHDLGLLELGELQELADDCQWFADEATAEIGAEIDR